MAVERGLTGQPERGVSTRWGEAGTCLHCGATMQDGEPDACIGWVRGVSEACCGHGCTTNAYVVLAHGGTLTGVDALMFLDLPSWPSAPPTRVPENLPRPGHVRW